MCERCGLGEPLGDASLDAPNRELRVGPPLVGEITSSAMIRLLREWRPSVVNSFRVTPIDILLRFQNVRVNPPCLLSGVHRYFRRRLSAEGAKPESNDGNPTWVMYVCGWVWYLELSREPRHVAQQTRYQNVNLGNGHCLGTISSGCDF